MNTLKIAMLATGLAVNLASAVQAYEVRPGNQTVHRRGALASAAQAYGVRTGQQMFDQRDYRGQVTQMNSVARPSANGTISWSP